MRITLRLKKKDLKIMQSSLNRHLRQLQLTDLKSKMLISGQQTRVNSKKNLLYLELLQWKIYFKTRYRNALATSKMQVSVFGCSPVIKVIQLTKLLMLVVYTLMKRTLKHSKLMK